MSAQKKLTQKKLSGALCCLRYGGSSELRDVVIQQVYGKLIQGKCDSCGEAILGDVGIARIVLDGEEGVCVGVCTVKEFHPIAQIPWARLTEKPEPPRELKVKHESD